MDDVGVSNSQMEPPECYSRDAFQEPSLQILYPVHVQYHKVKHHLHLSLTFLLAVCHHDFGMCSFKW